MLSLDLEAELGSDTVGGRDTTCSSCEATSQLSGNRAASGHLCSLPSTSPKWSGGLKQRR